MNAIDFAIDPNIFICISFPSSRACALPFSVGDQTQTHRGATIGAAWQARVLGVFFECYPLYSSMGNQKSISKLRKSLLRPCNLCRIRSRNGVTGQAKTLHLYYGTNRCLSSGMRNCSIFCLIDPFINTTIATLPRGTRPRHLIRSEDCSHSKGRSRHDPLAWCTPRPVRSS